LARRARQLGRDFGFVGQIVEQARQRLRLLGFQRQAPGAFRGVPAAAGDGAQQLAQPVVVGEAQHGFVVGHGG
jgi:hypothetical protein